MIEFLIDRGSDIEGKMPATYRPRNGNFWMGTALQTAVWYNQSEVISLLIRRGAIVDPLSDDWMAFQAWGNEELWPDRCRRVRRFQQIFGRRYCSANPPTGSELDDEIALVGTSHRYSMLAHPKRVGDIRPGRGPR